MRLASANSINVGRLLPQVLYYFLAVSQLPAGAPPPIIATPSGNFGNLTAGLYAKRLGLPVARFVAATNVNDVMPEYLETGVFRPRASQRDALERDGRGQPVQLRAHPRSSTAATSTRCAPTSPARASPTTR